MSPYSTLPVDEADEIVDGGLGAAAAHLAEEPVVGHQEERAPRLPQVHVQLARRLPPHPVAVLVEQLPLDPGGQIVQLEFLAS